MFGDCISPAIVQVHRCTHREGRVEFNPGLEKEMATHSCSCLENPRDGGAWWAAIYGVPQSRTRLKRLSSSSSIWAMVSQVELMVKNLPANAGDVRDVGAILGLGRSPG